MVKNEQNKEERMEYLEMWREANGFPSVEAGCYKEFCRLSSIKELVSYFNQMSEIYSEIRNVAHFYVAGLSKQIDALEAKGINDDFIEEWMNVLVDTDDNLGDAMTPEDWFDDFRDRIEKWKNIESILEYENVKTQLCFGDNICFFDVKKDEYAVTEYALEIDASEAFDDPIGRHGYIYVNLIENGIETCLGTIEFNYAGMSRSEEDYMDDDMESLEEIADIVQNLKDFAKEESKKMDAMKAFFEYVMKM